MWPWSALTRASLRFGRASLLPYDPLGMLKGANRGALPEARGGVRDVTLSPYAINTLPWRLRFASAATAFLKSASE